MSRKIDKKRILFPLIWLVGFGIVSLIIQDWKPFLITAVFSAGWYLCYIFGRLY